MKRIKRTIFQTFFYIGVVSCVFAQNRMCLVTGKVVDYKRNPIKIGVVLYKPTASDLIVYEDVNDDGSFVSEFDCSVRNLYLFVGEYNSENTMEIISPPIWKLRNSKTYPSLAGIRIPSNLKKELYVGTIIAPRYFKLNLKLQDLKGEPILPNELDYRFWIRLRTLDGRIVSFGSLNVLAYEKFVKNNSILTSLPEGKWIIEISLNGVAGPFLYPTKILDFHGESDAIQPITLVMTSKQSLSIYQSRLKRAKNK